MLTLTYSLTLEIYAASSSFEEEGPKGPMKMAKLASTRTDKKPYPHNTTMCVVSFAPSRSHSWSLVMSPIRNSLMPTTLLIVDCAMLCDDELVRKTQNSLMLMSRAPQHRRLRAIMYTHKYVDTW